MAPKPLGQSPDDFDADPIILSVQVAAADDAEHVLSLWGGWPAQFVRNFASCLPVFLS